MPNSQILALKGIAPAPAFDLIRCRVAATCKCGAAVFLALDDLETRPEAAKHTYSAARVCSVCGRGVAVAARFVATVADPPMIR